MQPFNFESIISKQRTICNRNVSENAPHFPECREIRTEMHRKAEKLLQRPASGCYNTVPLEVSMLEDRMYSLNRYFKDTFGEKVYRLSFNPGTTCPNRDGTIGTGGCIFCSEGGSGDFTPDCKVSVTKQLARAKAMVSQKGAKKFLGYSQAFTGTYGDPKVLFERFSEVLSEPDIVGLSIGTRPDCLPPEILTMLTELRERFQKPVYLELGLQTANDELAGRLHRGYPFSVYEAAVRTLSELHFPVVTHLILGLPTETEDDIFDTLQKVTALPVHGLKFSLLYILRGTKMELWYREHPEDFHFLREEDYYPLIGKCLSRIPDSVVIHRLTGDAPKKDLVAPLWTADKKHVLNTLTRELVRMDVVQGKNVFQ